MLLASLIPGWMAGVLAAVFASTGLGIGVLSAFFVMSLTGTFTTLALAAALAARASETGRSEAPAYRPQPHHTA